MLFIIIGASEASPLPGDERWDFVCVSVCVSVMDRRAPILRFLDSWPFTKFTWIVNQDQNQDTRASLQYVRETVNLIASARPMTPCVTLVIIIIMWTLQLCTKEIKWAWNKRLGE